MKSMRLFTAVALALVALCGLTAALAWQGPTASAAPAAPQTLPPPWLSDDDVVDAPVDFPPVPTVDGAIAPGEYAGAGKVSFAATGSHYREAEVFVKSDGKRTLYVAFDLALGAGKNHYAKLFLDTSPPGGSGLDASNHQLHVDTAGLMHEFSGASGSWVAVAPPVSWTAAATTTLTGQRWQAEFAIQYDKLGVTPGTFRELGLAIEVSDGADAYLWPAGGDRDTPSTWGSLVSSSDWGSAYWKPGPWEDYAPSGIPDFDQKQDGWFIPTGLLPPHDQLWTHDGPVAAANSLWWFDSKFETPDHAPPLVSDTYRLVTAYGPTDDHDPANVIPLVDDLAMTYYGTNLAFPGTNVISMFHGTNQYLRDRGLWDDYLVTLVISPTFEWVADEAMHSEDVILLLGFYEWIEIDERWARVGGHYVNVAGVDLANGTIAFSDPLIDGAEMGGPGRVLSGTLITPHVPGHPPGDHNDAGNVSHDVYTMTATDSPGGIWGPEAYGCEPDGQTFNIEMFGKLFGVNPHPEIPMEEYKGGPLVQTEVEFALAVSPYTWKSSGEWLSEGDDPITGTWQPWIDYAPNGVPDFSQKQDSWGPTPLGPPPYTYCGPVAAANSLWWFDSKFEPKPLTPTIPVHNDNYPLVWSYDPAGAWDDHDPSNVDSGNPPPPPPPLAPPPWPPFSGMGELVDELAAYFYTDGQLTTTMHSGTVITDLYRGIDRYITDRTLRQGYVITMAKSPDFWWVAEEVEHSEDVILLLGFWEEPEPGEFKRLGGHYVTVPGVDKQNGFIAFSDPYYDGAEFAWPYAYPGGWPTVMGRVADGWLIPHPPYHTHPPVVHNVAGNVSHDVYYVGPTDSPGGVWGPMGYVEGWDGAFEFQNGGGEPYTGSPIQTEVDGAVAVSPVADVWTLKGFETPTATPGTLVTLTIRFGNDGSLPARDVVLSDTWPAELVNPAWSAWTSNGLPVSQRPGMTFTWDLPDLKWMESGMITVTAQVDPTLDWPAAKTITNRVEIATSSIEQYQLPPQANVHTDTLTVQTPDVSITKTLVSPAPVENGETLTFTLTFTNAGPVAARVVIITDPLDAQLFNGNSAGIWTSYPCGGPMIGTTGNTHTWAFGTVPASGWGVVTLTAELTPTWPITRTLTNEALISALFDNDPSNNQAEVQIPLTGPTVYLPLVLRDYP